jgi:peptidoglycan L-alanyl-D-glutamate endopeptidase CwlK
MELTNKDYELLTGVHPDLVRVLVEAARITTVPFKITEGRRTLERQRALKKAGLSTTLRSRHLTGHAVDLVPTLDVNHDGKLNATDFYAWPAYYKLAPIIKQAARNVGVPLEWGGDWRNFKDGPHWQLPWKAYPEAAHFLQPDEPPMGDLTEQAYSVRTTAALGGGGAIAAAGPGLSDLILALMGQQVELTSGDWVRITVAAVILGLTIFAIYKTMRGR